MIVLLHVAIALLSMVQATYTFLKPSRQKLHISYGLVATTFVSGTYLVLSTHAGLMSACLAGLLYLGGTVSALVAANHKLAAAHKQD